MGDSIHKTHFQVPEMPWREKEKQAILLLQKVIRLNRTFLCDQDLNHLFSENPDLVDWVMKYKGE